MKKPKWYVVWKGYSPGIYTTWAATKAVIDGYIGARYQSFGTLIEAEAAYVAGPDVSGLNDFSGIARELPPEVILDSVAVDAACSGNPGVVEYRGVYLATKEVIFYKKIDGLGTNNLGEFLAIVHALALQHANKTALPIYSDSVTALAWVRNKRCKSSITRSSDTAPILDLVQRAQVWLENHEIGVPIHKWITTEWGEIPADFERKN
jgi:ribonuclease HI